MYVILLTPSRLLRARNAPPQGETGIPERDAVPSATLEERLSPPAPGTGREIDA